MLNETQKKEYLLLRKKFICKDFSFLNDKQLEAVLATEGPLLILAGAGSGKTTVLINRIANLIKYGKASDCGEIPADATVSDLEIIRKGGSEAEQLCSYGKVEPWRILAITFTNKAAAELKTRLAGKLGDIASDIWACTFHSACVRILRRDAELLGYQSNFTIYDTDDTVSLIKKIEKDLDLDNKEFSPKAIAGEISALKNLQVSPSEYEADARRSNDFRRIRYAAVYSEYQKRTFSANAMDFDDLISNTVKILNEYSEARQYWQRRFKYILIDEYQDTNHLQYLLSSLLCGNGNLCVVGDDDQSIYKFRGANIENILSFESEYKGCRTIRLEQNYRSTEHILSAANSVIRNNTGRKGKTLWTNNGTGDPVCVSVVNDEREEAELVASRILRSVDTGDSWNDNAILYRMNAQSNQFEYALKKRGIPYKVIGGMRFFDRSEIKDLLAYMCLISSLSDDLRLSRIINVPARGIGEKSLDLARTAAAESGRSIFDVLVHAEDYPELKKLKPKFEAFTKLILDLKAFSETNSSDLFFDELIEKTGYIRVLEEKNTLEDASRIENVKELKTTILTYINDTKDTTLDGFLADVALYTDVDAIHDDNDSVLMMTVHSSKGLEFTNVYLVGMEETVFPGIRAIGDQEEMEEERRLCYVAITRAKKELFISAAKQRMIFGRTVANNPSRFIMEINRADIDPNDPFGINTVKKPPVNTSFSRPREQEHRYIPPQQKQPAAPARYATGDEVVHKAFGAGVITSMKPMGGDYLVEINFSSTGPKKLMLKAASVYMQKK